MNECQAKALKKCKAGKVTSLVLMILAIAFTVAGVVATVYFTIMRANIIPTEDNRPWQFASQVQYFFEHGFGIIENFQTICGIVLGGTIVFGSIILLAYQAYAYFRKVLNNNDYSAEIALKALKTASIVAIVTPFATILLDYVGLIIEHSIWPDVILHFGRGYGLTVIAILLGVYVLINLACGIAGLVILKKIKAGKCACVAAEETEQKAPAEEPAEEIAEETAEEEPVAEVAAAEEGNVSIGYDRSYMGKLMQTKDETKLYYSAIKNALLSYKGKGKKISNRISWKYETFNIGRNKIVKLKVKGKTLCVYLALNAKDYEGSKYKIEAVEGGKADGDTAVMYRISNARRAKYVLALIADAMEKQGFSYVEGDAVNYAKDLKFKSDKALVKAGLAKEVAVTSFPKK